MMPQYNKITGLHYQGKNQTELIATKVKNDYNSDAWLTFLQANGLGLMIKKGSKSVAVFKGFVKTEEKDKDGKIKESSAPLGFARVFNMDCTQESEFSREDEILEETTTLEEKLEDLESL